MSTLLRKRELSRDGLASAAPVFVLALTSIVLLLVGLGLGQARSARRVQIAGLTSTFATTQLAALLWL